MANIIDVKNLRVWDNRDGEVLVDGVSFYIPEGKCLAIVGESGSGKSMTVKAISGIHKRWIETSGSIDYMGYNLLELKGEKYRQLRGSDIYMIFQDGMSAFDPSVTLIKTMREIYMENRQCTKAEADKVIYESARKVRLRDPEKLLDKYPHQLSGGMLQRIMIAMALALNPRIIIADEPTTALDTITQYEIVNEFLRLKEEYGNTMIFISHDLGLARKLADYIVVMQNGKLVEEGLTEEIFGGAKMEYTRYLIDTRKALGDNYRRLFGGGALA